ncbi:MAG: hypothetical protein ACON5K_05185 [Bacteroidia bacterium]
MYDPRKGRLKNDANNPDGSGCVTVLIVLGLIIYFPLKCYKEFTKNPLEYHTKVKRSNFRKSPNLNGEIIKTVNKGTQFLMLSDSSFSQNDSSWVQGVIANDTGWIYMDLLEHDIWK